MFILKYVDKMWKIFLKNFNSDEIFVCSFYDERLAQVKLNDLNRMLIEIVKYQLHDQD